MAITKIRGNTQIKSATITNVEIAANAGIDLSKLARGADIILRDGSVAFTGNVDLGSNKLINVAAPSANGDAANKSYVDGAVSDQASASTSAINSVASDLAAEVARAEAAEGAIASDLAAEVARAEAAEAAIAADLAAEVARAEAAESALDGRATSLESRMGSAEGNIGYLAGNTIYRSAFVTRQSPTGAIDGSNTDFALANSPMLNSESVFLNGLLQEPGVGNDYTIVDNTITFSVAPVVGDRIRVSYIVSYNP